MADVAMAGIKKFRYFNNALRSITYDDALQSGLRQAAHCCFYSPRPFHLFKNYESKAYVSMQLRFDGMFGFPGGCIDKGEDIFEGLNRELREEINLNEKYFVTQKDYQGSDVYQERICLHFYMKEVSPEEFVEIERNAVNARDYGKEVMGVVRVPLYFQDDGYGGFPAFLSNKFAACAKSQLLDALIASKILTVEEIEKALSKCCDL